MTARVPPPEPTSSEIVLVWVVRIIALLIVPPLVGASLGLAVRIFVAVAGVD